MNFHTKKLIVYWRSSKPKHKKEIIWGIIGIPFGLIHELLHVVFAVLFLKFEKLTLDDFMQVHGSSLRILQMGTRFKTRPGKLDKILSIIIAGSPLLVPCVSYLLIGWIGIPLAILTYESWQLSDTDKVVINNQSKKLFNN